MIRANYDTRKYPLCAPFDGTRGEDFLAFERDFTAAIADECDDYSSLLECLHGTDPAPGGAAERRASVKRKKTLFGKIFRHISNEGLRKRLSALSGEDHMNGRSAWLLIERECRPVLSDLDVERLNVLWVNASIANSVGHTPTTCLDYKRYLNGLNVDRPDSDKKSLTECATKFLNSFKQPEALAVEAMKELKATGTSRAFVFTNPHDTSDPRNGQRDFDAIVSHFDKLWSHMYARGLIRPQVVRNSELPSTRVDGEQFLVEEVLEMGEASDGGAHSNNPNFGRSISKEMRCFNCHGFGHRSPDCPSEKRRRDIQDVIKALQSAQSQTPKNGGARKGATSTKKKGRTQGGNNRKRVSVFMLEDGTLEDQDGNSFAPQEDTCKQVTEVEQDDDSDEGKVDDEIQYIESRFGHLLPPDISLIGEDDFDPFLDWSEDEYDDDEKGGAMLKQGGLRPPELWGTRSSLSKKKRRRPRTKAVSKKTNVSLTTIASNHLELFEPTEPTGTKESTSSPSSSTSPSGKSCDDRWDLSMGMKNSWNRDVDAWLCGYEPKERYGSSTSQDELDAYHFF